jgi:hypothetical protein
MTPIPNLDGVALQPSDPGFADECLGYNRLVTHRPEVVVGAASAHDVAAAVCHAREHDWSVGVAATGHGPTRPVSGVQHAPRAVQQALPNSADVQAHLTW